jgi:hypothetical protein
VFDAADNADRILKTIRPSFPNTNFHGIDDATLRANLQALSDYRTSPIPMESGCLIEGSAGFNSILIASESMCTPPSVDGGCMVPSPNALIKDGYYNLLVTAGASHTFTAGAPTATLAVSAIDRALPAGFQIKFPAGYLVLTAAAAAGATSLALSRLYNDVAVVSSDVAINANGYFPQGGICCPTVRNWLLCADPNPRISSNFAFETTRKYACDGLAFEASAALIQNLILTGFPGHGIYASYALDPATQSANFAPLDHEKIHIENTTVRHSLCGLTIAATDAVTDNHTSQGCRDYGMLLLGNAIQVGKNHNFGCGIAAMLLSGAGTIGDGNWELENSGIGLDVAETAAGSIIGASVRAFSNSHCDARIMAPNCYVAAIHINNSTTTADGGDPNPTGYSVVIGTYADRLDLPSAYIDTTSGNGLLIGSNASDTLQCQQINARVGGSGTHACHVAGHLAGTHLNVVLDDSHTNGFYVEDGIALTANRITLRGASSRPTRWADGTTGTLGSPNIPSGVRTSNQIEIYTY